MAITINVNGVAISYPQTGDPEWGDDATEFAIQVAGALAKIGQSTSPATNNITIPSGNLTVTTGNTDLGGTLDVTGATTLDSTLDVTGKILVSSDITIGGVLIADDSTNVTTAPPITFTGDLNTGIGHSAADTLDFVTGGQPRFRIESTGQIKAVYESYNTTLHNGYLCRAFANFDGTGSISSNQTVRASGNISSITKIATGDYEVNLIVAMPDSNYVVFAASFLSSTSLQTGCFLNTVSASRYRIFNYSTSGVFYDESLMYTAVFR